MAAAQESVASPREVLPIARALSEEFAKTYPLRDQRREFPHEEMTKLKASGLLAAPIPRAYGGLDLSYRDILESILILAEGFPSVAQMFLVHCTIVQSHIEDSATQAQKQFFYRQIIGNNAFIAAAGAEKKSKHVMAYEATFAPSQGGVLVNGKKFFCTGSLAADLILVVGMTGKNMARAIIPKETPGVVVHDDWDAMGQRGTSSGSIDFNDVFVERNLVLPVIAGPEGNLGPENLFGPMTQSYFAAIFVGIAKAALRHAIQYVRTKTRPLTGSGVERAVEDPYILRQTGTLRAYVSAAESSLYRAAEQVEETLASRGVVVPEELARRRAAASVAVAEAKLFSTEVALRVCQEVFQVCGARSALSVEDTDRFWRDARTLTLHDPVDYRAKLIGEYLLQDKYPVPTGRS